MLIPIAVLAGLLLGLLRGGTFRNVKSLRLIWAPVVLLGVVMQTLAGQINGFGGAPVLTIGTMLLLGALARNLHLRGVAIVSLGLLLNLVVLGLNGHVPTRFEALQAVGSIAEDVPRSEIIGIGPVGQLETSDTSFAILGDIIHIPVLDELASFGDLIAAAGLAVVAMNLLLRRRGSGVSVDDLLGVATNLGEPSAVQSSVVNADQLGWGNDEVGTLVANEEPVRPYDGVQNVHRLANDSDVVDLREQPELDHSSSEESLLAPFPYPDSSTH